MAAPSTTAAYTPVMFASMLFLPAFKAGIVIDRDLKGVIVLQWDLVMG